VCPSGGSGLASLPSLGFALNLQRQITGGKIVLVEAVMGCQPLLPGQFLAIGKPLVEEFLEKLHELTLKVPRLVLHKNNPLPVSFPPFLLSAELVFVRHDSNLVLFADHCTAFCCKLVSPHRLKPCLSLQNTPVALPPWRSFRPSALSGAKKTPHQNPGQGPLILTASLSSLSPPLHLPAAQRARSVRVTGWPPAILPGPSKGSQPYAPKSRDNINWPKYKGPRPVLVIFIALFWANMCTL
jgi:hypothetical protein